MMFLYTLLLMTQAMAQNAFLSGRVAYAPGARTHGQVESYSIGLGMRIGDSALLSDPTEFKGEFVVSLNYSKNVHLGFLDKTMPEAFGPSVRIRVFLVEHPKIKLYFSEKFALLFDLSGGDEVLALEQNAGLGMKIRVFSEKKQELSLCPEMGFIPIMWAPYFSLDANWAF